mmetsp:Transcript_13559/g.15539  ORF Transcript_13559/g.15539 Transcript_13559/m.15539 type:complete len:155 (+) Transcript_13559:87-551(+)
MSLMKVLKVHFIILSCTLLCLLTNAQPPNGWKMTDRFSGFRYEMIGSQLQGVGMKDLIQGKADELFCFGWTQYTKRGSIVGEARCYKEAGRIFKKWLTDESKKDNLANGALVESVTIKEYADTKIRLHFSHFKQLDNERETCFRDEPHQCPHFV